MSLKVANSELEVFYNHYLSHVEALQNNRLYELGTDDKGNDNWIKERMYYFLCDYYSKEDRFPSYVSDDKYERATDCKTVYHGFRDISHAASYLWDYNRHYGYGIHGNGFYTSSSTDEAINYTESQGEVDYKNIVEFKFNSDRTIDYDNILLASKFLKSSSDEPVAQVKRALSSEQIDKLKELKAFIWEKDDMGFYLNFGDNFSCVALYLGFDAIKTMRKNNIDEHYIVLLPSRLLVSETEFNRVMSEASGDFKGNCVETSEK